MIFIDDIHKAEQEAKSIIDEANKKANIIKSSAEYEMDERISVAMNTLKNKKNAEIAEVDNAISVEKKVKAQKSSDAVDTLERKAKLNKTTAVDFVLKKI